MLVTINKWKVTQTW